MGTGRTIFIEHQNDLWAGGVPSEMIVRVLQWCRNFPENKYVFQTKNPARYHGFMPMIPEGSTLGITLETDKQFDCMGKAPCPKDRAYFFATLPRQFPKFVTVEPILDCDPNVLSTWIVSINPDFVNIGADSKRHGLPEPSAETILRLIDFLNMHKVTIRKKTNLARLLASHSIWMRL
jgi:hypothetical protein